MLLKNSKNDNQLEEKEKHKKFQSLKKKKILQELEKNRHEKQDRIFEKLTN